MGPLSELWRRLSFQRLSNSVFVQTQLLRTNRRCEMRPKFFLGTLIAVMAAAVLPAPAPSPDEIQTALNAAHSKYKGLQEGKNADYIPALAKVDPELFGIALITVDGKAYTAGDIKSEVSIQSISKVFTLANVLQESGVVAVEVHKGKEMNPFVNPGAIATTSMVKGANADQIWSKIIGTYSDFAGRQLKVDQEVYKSASDTNQRNRA